MEVVWTCVSGRDEGRTGAQSKAGGNPGRTETNQNSRAPMSAFIKDASQQQCLYRCQRLNPAVLSCRGQTHILLSLWCPPHLLPPPISSVNGKIWISPLAALLALVRCSVPFYLSGRIFFFTAPISLWEGLSATIWIQCASVDSRVLAEMEGRTISVFPV